MRTITGNLWDYFGNAEKYAVCITTNGFVKKDGTAVMGRGCAREACYRIPNLPTTLAAHIKKNGNVACYLKAGLISFPVKHAWYEDADPVLISKSAEWLQREAELTPHITYILPRPGCGNGKLKWENVKPLLVSLPDNVLVIAYE